MRKPPTKRPACCAPKRTALCLQAHSRRKLGSSLGCFGNHRRAMIQPQTRVSIMTSDPFEKVVSLIGGRAESTISVPELSQLLGVKTTTLNARFRRNQIAVRTIGRTNYIPCEQAVKLAALHRYALIGW